MSKQIRESNSPAAAEAPVEAAPANMPERDESPNGGVPASDEPPADALPASGDATENARQGTCPHTAACAMCAAGIEGTPEMPDEELLYDLADLFKTFGDTTRIKILYALMGSELCVADLAALVGATQSAVSHQLRTLKQARLVKFQRDGKNVIYSLSDDHVFTMLAQGMTHICE